MKFRLIPLVIASCLTLLLVRVADMLYQDQPLSAGLMFADIRAQEPKETAQEPAAPAEEGASAAAEAPAGDATGEGGEGEEAVEGEQITRTLTPPEAMGGFTETEINVLKRLRARRETLEEWAADLQAREHSLDITEANIDRKLEELRALKAEVETLLADYSEKEEAKIKSLVKIYENMKPKAAAQIFQEMDTQILLQVVERMKEKAVANIFAKMQPDIATDVTERFAEFGTLPPVLQK